MRYGIDEFIMKEPFPRRSFLKKSVAASLAMPLLVSLERCLAQAAPANNSPAPPAPDALCPRWHGTIGKVKISRLICGGNLISGWAHSRDLIYVSDLLKHYFTDAKITETWQLCEQHGINTMIFNPSDGHAIEVYRKYRKQGGRIQYLAQISPKPDEFKSQVKQAVDDGAVGAFLVGNLGDEWTRDNKVDLIGELVALIKDQKIIAGVGGHELRTVTMVEKAGIAPDFYVKTLHANNYWSKRQPGQDKDVIENYGIDNYWCKDPQETVRYMSEMTRPWIAYKVLAAGAIHPKAGLKHAFENGADFALVGMFDFQVAQNVAIANELLASQFSREREWVA
jgi:hypothetical protein